MPKIIKPVKAKGIGSKRATTKRTQTKATIGTVTGKPTKASLTDKVVGSTLMVAMESDGVSFYVASGNHELFISSGHENYAAMVSLLLMAHSNNSAIAVKYSKLFLPKSDRRTVSAIASGVHAVISGGSF